MIIGSVQCSPMVAYIVQKWDNISRYVEKEIRSWRDLKIKRISKFSYDLAVEIERKFSDETGIDFVKDIWFDSWKSIGIKIEGRDPWYYPYSIILLCTFNITKADIIAELERKSSFIDIIAFIDVCIRKENRITIDFNRNEVDFLNYVMFTRTDSIWEIPSFEELGRLMSSNLPESKTGGNTSRYRTRGLAYWKKLDKFFNTGILLNYCKIGLSPVVVIHSRELTELEKKYTKYSFFERGDYYSLLFIPAESSWIKENEGIHFKSPGKILKLEVGWNLTHFTPKAENRWGYYPGLVRKSIDKIPDYSFTFDEYCNTITGFHEKDFQLLAELSRTIGRIITTARQLTVTEPYVHQRVSFFSQNKIFHTKVDLHYCGLDTGLFIFLHSADGRNIDLLNDVRINLKYFPNYVIFSNDHCLYAKVKIPSRWLLDLITEVNELDTPKGAFNDGEIVFRMKNYRTRESIRKSLNDLSNLVIFHKNVDGLNRLDWTFEIAK
ncbi:MAG: hypothetical protein ACTSP4_02640 [Candidatus Hodarchaeales archaeon]